MTSFLQWRFTHSVAFVFALLAPVAVVPASAEQLKPSEIRVIDGDTLQISANERVRLLDIDTPETHTPRCQAELERGQEASRRLRALIQSGGQIWLARSGQQDKYGRTLAHVSVNGRDVGQILLSAGLAVQWRPGRDAWLDRQRHWCGIGS